MTVCSMTASTIIKFWKTLLNKRFIKKEDVLTNKITEGASVENIKMLQHPYSDFLIWTEVQSSVSLLVTARQLQYILFFFVGAYFVAFSKKKKKKKKKKIQELEKAGGGVNKWNRGFDASLTYYVTCKATIVEVHTT